MCAGSLAYAARARRKRNKLLPIKTSGVERSCYSVVLSLTPPAGIEDLHEADQSCLGVIFDFNHISCECSGICPTPRRWSSLGGRLAPRRRRRRSARACVRDLRATLVLPALCVRAVLPTRVLPARGVGATDIYRAGHPAGRARTAGAAVVFGTTGVLVLLRGIEVVLPLREPMRRSMAARITDPATRLIAYSN